MNFKLYSLFIFLIIGSLYYLWNEQEKALSRINGTNEIEYIIKLKGFNGCLRGTSNDKYLLVKSGIESNGKSLKFEMLKMLKEGIEEDKIFSTEYESTINYFIKIGMKYVKVIAKEGEDGHLPMWLSIKKKCVPKNIKYKIFEI